VASLAAARSAAIRVASATLAGGNASAVAADAAADVDRQIAVPRMTAAQARD